MSTWPRQGPVTPPVIAAFYHPEIYKPVSSASPTSLTWPTANRAWYFPYLLPEPVTVTKAWWQNGAAVSGTVSVGIYDDQGHQLVTTGSQTQTGTTSIQSVDITDTLIQAGLLYLGMSVSNTTAAFWASAGLQGGGVQYSIYLQDTAHPLPNPATFTSVAISGSGNNFWKFGFLVAPRTVL